MTETPDTAKRPDDEVDDEVEENEHTVMVDRKKHATPADDADEHTVMVDRKKHATPADDADEHTVMVDRKKRATPADDADEHTVMVDRKKRATPADDAPEDHTIAISRGAKGSRKGAIIGSGAPSLPRTEVGKRRRGIATPPIPQGFAPRAKEAVGPGAIEEYAPREIPKPPPTPRAIEAGPDATRVAAPAMPSVSRHRQRVASASFIAFAVSCVLSLGAAIGLAIWLF